MTTLVCAEIDLKKNSIDNPSMTAVAALKDFMDKNATIIADGATLRFSLCLKPLTSVRASPIANKEALQRLLALPGAPTEWVSEDKVVSLFFKNGQYWFGESEVYLTAQEQFILYRKLALGAKNVDGYAQVKAQLRRKFGINIVKRYL